MEVGNFLMIHNTNLRIMALSLSEIKKRVESPQRKQEISKAIRHEQRLRFHTESCMDSSEVQSAANDFLFWVKTLIPKDKYNIFLNLFRYPIPTIELTETIYNELEKVFEGRDQVFDYQFNDPKLRDDWEWYRNSKLNEPGVWRDKGWNAVKTAISSVLIVDLPSEQTGEYPEPYFYFLPIESVIDYELKGDELSWIIFKQPDNKIAVFDEFSYRVYGLDDSEKLTGEFIESPHNLGYCPADFFWSVELTKNMMAVKKSPISSQLSNLDWLLFFTISKRHLDLYAPYPIYSTYTKDCDFRNEATGDYCDGGYLRDASGNYHIMNNGMVEMCPVCSDKVLTGAGSLIEMNAPQSKDDPDLRNPVQITTIDRDSLDYNVNEVKRITNEIYVSATGESGDVLGTQRINEKQVIANFESKVNILNNLKGNLEHAMSFVDDTCCKLRYGDNYLGSSISLGSEYYIHTVDDLYTQYDQAKKNGSSDVVLDSISEKIIYTENRNNPTQLQRILILKHLEPYNHYTLDELLKLRAGGLLDEDLLNIKINFIEYINRFERENINIIEFGEKLEFDTKIKIIKQKLLDYAKEGNGSVDQFRENAQSERKYEGESYPFREEGVQA